MDGMVLPIPLWPTEKKVCGTWLKLRVHSAAMEQGNTNEATWQGVGGFPGSLKAPVFTILVGH